MMVDGKSSLQRGRQATAIAFLFATAASTLLAAPVEAATATTGSVGGVVRDPNGVPLAGVAVKLQGPGLLGKREATTNARGLYRLPLVPPAGGYQVEARLVGFEPVAAEGLSVRLGRETRLELTLFPATADEIVVTAVAAPVDLRKTASMTSITAEQLELLPTSRDFQYLTVLAPGVVFDRPSNPRTPTGAATDHPSPNVGGATHLENDYVIEGLSTRDPLTGASATKLTMDFVAEIQVMTGEFTADYGRALGGVVQVVTKSGGNDFRGTAFAYRQQAGWTSRTVRASNRGVDSYDLGHDRDDWGASLGGPLQRDRAWAFLSYDRRRDVAPLHILNLAHALDRREQIKVEENVYAGKLSLAATPSLLVTLAAFGNPTTTNGWLYGGSIVEPGVALVQRRSGSTNTVARWEALIGDRWTVEASAGFHRQDLSSAPTTPEGRSAPMQGDFSSFPVFYRGGHPYQGSEDAGRDAYSARLSRQLGRHELAIGGDYERNRFEHDIDFAGYWFFGPTFIDSEVGVQDLLEEVLADFSGYGTNHGLSLFVRDRWQPRANLSVDVGLRWERQELSSGQGVAIAAGRAGDGSIQRRHQRSFVFDGNWAPRLAVAWDPTGGGRARLYATAGRYFEAIPVYLNVWSLNGFRDTINQYYGLVPHTSEDWYNRNGSPLDSGQWLLFWSNASGWQTNPFAPGPVPIDPGTRLQHQDAASLGGEIALGRTWVAGARLVRRELGDVIEDHYVFDHQGRAVDYAISNVGRGPYASELRTPKRVYEAVEITLQRRLSDRWQVISSFVSARARGDIDGLFSYANPNFTAPNTTFEVERPEYQINSYGRLRGDRPYQLKVHSSYTFPFGLTISEGFIYSAGVPYSAFAPRNLSGGVRQIYLLPRGSAGRTPDWHTLDLHAAWPVPLRRQREVSVTLIADAFNVTDSHRALDVDQEYFIPGMPGYAEWVAPGNRDEHGRPRFREDLPRSPFFGTPTRYQAPRTFQVGLKVGI